MPTFIVHELGKSPKTATLNLERISIGREACDLILNNVSVSRQHADVRLVAPGQWILVPMSLDNPLLVNGQVATGQVPLSEGAELQVGRFMVIFSLEASARSAYTQDRGQYEAVCAGCGWSGVMTSLVQAPICPKCGGVQFNRADDLGAAAVRGPVISGPTACLTTNDVEKLAARLHEAKKGRIERLDRVAGLPARFDLAEDRTCRFGKPGESEMPLQGFRMGALPVVVWERSGYVVRAGGLWPRLKVNGESVKQHRLKAGDTIVLGGNSFRFVVA